MIFRTLNGAPRAIAEYMSTFWRHLSCNADVVLAVATMAAALLLGAPEAEAQTTSDFQIWTATFFTAHALPGPRSPTFWLDVHARRSDPGTVLILRPGLGYAFTPWASVWAGYAWNPLFIDATGSRVDVQGVWEQVTFTYHRASKLTLQSRTRFEQFWSDAGAGMFPRIRQFVRANYRPSEDVPVGVALWDEAFFGLKSVEWADAGFFENRIFAGLAIFGGKGRFRVEPGYMFVNVSQGSVKRLNHVLGLFFFVSFKPK
jgi:hypothetical protein